MAIERLDLCYTIYGTGGWESCMVVQDKLQDFGLCSCLRWDPDPRPAGDDRSNWRFLFETNLQPVEALDLLGGYASRYNLQLR